MKDEMIEDDRHEDVRRKLTCLSPSFVRNTCKIKTDTNES